MLTKIKTNTVTDLRKDTVRVLDSVKDSKDPIFILQNSKVAGVLLNYEEYQDIVEIIEDYLDIKESEKAMNEDFIDYKELKSGLPNKNIKKSK